MLTVRYWSEYARVEPEPSYCPGTNPQLHPVVRDDCKEKKCAKLAKHFEHCQEKVQGGEGFKGEDCVEELYVAVSIPRDCQPLTTLPAVR